MSRKLDIDSAWGQRYNRNTSTRAICRPEPTKVELRAANVFEGNGGGLVYPRTRLNQKHEKQVATSAGNPTQSRTLDEAIS